jgi:hypothetical protein
VAPVFQAEVAARAIVWAAEHAPRELKVGWPTVRAVYAERVLPGRLDRYLARNGYAGQQSEEPVERDHRDNLFDALDGDHGAHGRFDSESRAASRLLDLRLAFGDAMSAIRRGARRRIEAPPSIPVEAS